jgi:RNA polymerase sigma-70 factor (ECF subfamily)
LGGTTTVVSQLGLALCRGSGIPLLGSIGKVRVVEIEARATAARADKDEAGIVAGLRRRDERAFTALFLRYNRLMVQVARLFVRDIKVAEEVVQETWLGVINGIDGFEARASLRTWVFRILKYQALYRREREGRTVPFSALAATDAALAEPSVDAERFRSRDCPDLPFYWVSEPHGWPEQALLAAEVRRLIARAIAALPESQRAVVLLRDVEGWSAAEVCESLEVTEANQRVLLHRGRSAVRARLEQYLEGVER